ncbi:MAG: HAD family hydrolase [Eubacterium sp.]|nr:HAD family hydrolase [Eubacterium sp.]
MTKAVIFDFYETLVTNYLSPLYFGEHIAKDLHISEKKFRKIWDATDDARTLGKMTFEDTIAEIMRVNGINDDKLFETIVKKRKENTFETIKHYHKDLIPLFDTLKSLNIKIGLVSNCYSEEVNPIRECVLFSYFDAVLLSCEIGLKKPDPEIYHQAAVALGAPVKDIIYVGDGGSNELYGARDMGMYTLQATWFMEGNKRKPVKPDPEFKIVDRPMAILNFLS